MARRPKNKGYEPKSKKTDLEYEPEVSQGKRSRSKQRISGKAHERQNDPTWYFTSPELANQAAQLSFQSYLGTGTVIDDYQAPTIARIDLATCPGNTVSCMYDADTSVVDNTSNVQPANEGKAGINMMAAKLYTLLSSFTGRTASYGPQDVAMMILSVATMAEWSETIRRAFGLALTYNPRNRSIPEGLLHSMGLDVVDLRENLSIYRMRFNMAIAKVNQIPLLENVAFIKKSRDMYQRIYQDDPTSMSQLFYYMPTYTYTLDEIGDPGGSVLRAKFLSDPSILPSGMVTMGDWLTILEEQINALLTSSTLNFVYADILNMANKLHITTWKFDYLAENYVVMPEYNINALLQFHNLTIVGEPVRFQQASADEKEFKKKYRTNNSRLNDFYTTGGADIFSDPDTNSIIYNPLFSVGSTQTILTKAVIDMPSDNPSTEDRIEALRFASLASGAAVNGLESGQSDSADLIYATMVCLPDHYVTHLEVFGDIYVGSSFASWQPMAWRNSASSAGGTVPSAALRLFAKATQFEHAPLKYYYDNLDDRIKSIVGQLQFYTTYDYLYLSRVNDAMFIGLFDFRV